MTQHLFLLLSLLACNGGDSDSPATDDTGVDTDATDTDTDTDTDPDTDTDTDTDTDAPDPATVPLDGVCADDVQWGSFLVESGVEFGFVSGKVDNGVVNLLTRVVDSGDCTIWRKENPFCDPTCSPGYTCDVSGECVVYPTSQDLGTVTVAGLANPVSMEPRTPGFGYFDTALPNPPWGVPGSLITLETGGGAYSPVTLYGVAPAPLVPVSMDWVIVEGEPLAVAWDVPTSAVRTELVLALRIDQHGTTPSSIECVFADDGAGEVPADAIATLMAFGVTGFPAGDLVRRTADSVDIGDGCIDLSTRVSLPASIEIAGYTPCTRDEECPKGSTCNEPLERCE